MPYSLGVPGVGKTADIDIEIADVNVTEIRNCQFSATESDRELASKYRRTISLSALYQIHLRLVRRASYEIRPFKVDAMRGPPSAGSK